MNNPSGYVRIGSILLIVILAFVLIMVLLSGKFRLGIQDIKLARRESLAVRAVSRRMGQAEFRAVASCKNACRRKYVNSVYNEYQKSSLINACSQDCLQRKQPFLSAAWESLTSKIS